MFKKCILFVIVGILSFQIFPFNWAGDAAFGYDIEQNMAMNEPDDDLEIEFSKIIKDKIFDHNLFVNEYAQFEKLNTAHYSFLITTLPKYSSNIICPPPNFI
jgi:hypothetical protein